MYNSINSGLFNHLLFERHEGDFQFLPVTNKAAVNICVYDSTLPPIFEIVVKYAYHRGFTGGISGKEPAYQCRKRKKWMFDPWVRKIPWRRKRQPTLAFLPREFHGQRSLAVYSPWSHKEVDMTEQLTLSLSRLGL